MVEIDRSFATQPPACIGGGSAFKFAEGTEWARAAVESTKEIADLKTCLQEVQAWLDIETASRGEQK